MAEAKDDYPAHVATYTAFSKLVTFSLLWIIVLLVSMALGLIAHLPLLGLVLGIGGSIALLVAFAVLN
ncbi:aa3-type cytochrome c oxidase subunit IV [uncultured Reyranella sp.]|uniref:aa3-type cytochrome c oxidase subunit IV n=1 Tax=uncultured Reyranella sp. TaxID=735512 RepID=UPI0025E1A240|nr:aa3-type cytochrome c oxidase subunit IV [uncultured Reyranella sp.]